jgi:hypothetical protein
LFGAANNLDSKRLRGAALLVEHIEEFVREVPVPETSTLAPVPVLMLAADDGQ